VSPKPAAFAALLLLPLFCRPAEPSFPEHRLRLHNAHTGERIDVVYRSDGVYLPEATAKLESFLRDRRTGDVRPVDPALYDLLDDLLSAVERPASELDLVCGYRTPRTNEYLRRRTAGVAKHSFHMRGEAVDVRLPGTPTSRLRDAALALRRGGVGYYRDSDFLHVDVGPVRRW
jgi:uncharacterized protein YcbK (DUF882 family)